jgi:uncharacterized protein YPO0396
MTVAERAAPAVLFEPDSHPSPQWLAESMQLVNWGGFEGHHTIVFADSATLLSGASGTGKSTLLDAYIALMMDSNTPFNGASNDNVTGRARSGEQRSILSYMRGKTDASREPGTGRLRDDVMRGLSSATWSAVAMTWRNDAGERLTALRLYYAPVSAQLFADVTMKLATIKRAFDLSDVAEFAADVFPARPMEARFPDLDFHASYAAFAATLHSYLGIGVNSDGGKALKLLARIQGGRQFATVDGLYKEMVLEQPRTFPAADRAVEHFADIQAAHDMMRTAEQQVEVLKDIPRFHEALMTARAEVELIDTFRIHSAAPNTPFALWRCRTEASLLTDAINTNRDAHRAATDTAGAARDRHEILSGQLEDVLEQKRLNGGDALEACERSLTGLSADLAKAAAARGLFGERTEALRRPVATQVEFEALLRDSHAFLEGFSGRREGLRDARDQLIREGQPLLSERGDLLKEDESLAGRRGLVPHDLHAARLEVAEAMDLTADDLPFVAELIDMRPEFEAWRTATELALGGFALTMLVDQQLLPLLRRKINPREIRRRLRFEGVPSHETPREQPDVATMPGRLQLRDSAFTGWLTNTLVAKFGYVCVEEAAGLDSVGFGLTITGQTRQGQRGAHGGHGAPHVIGFSNEGRRQEIAARVKTIDARLGQLQRKTGKHDEQARSLENERDAHLYVTAATWTAIDVATVQEALDQQNAIRDQLLWNSDVLQALQKRQEGLQGALGDASREMYTAEAEQQRLDEAHEQLLADQRRTAAFREQLEDDPSVTLTDTQDTRLRTEYEHLGRPWKLTDFRSSIPAIRDALSSKTERARRDAEAQEKLLSSAFQRFQDRWERPNLGTGADSYDGYQEILDHLLAEGLHERRLKFSRQVSDWTGVDLLALHGAYEESIEEIEARLLPVNDILAGLPFGAHGDRLHINLRRVESRDITQFRRELKTLASDTTQLGSPQEVEARFARLKRFIDRIRKSDKVSQREYFIDVRRHVEIDAERRDTAGRQLSVYTSIGGKSGGESQELVAFIVGAALRYQLGDADMPRPRYAPVFLDEGFVKSDSEFTGRAVRAWQVLGFQLIIGAPLDKVTGIEPHVDELYQVTKNARNHSHVRKIHPTTSAGHAGSPE